MELTNQAPAFPGYHQISDQAFQSRSLIYKGSKDAFPKLSGSKSTQAITKTICLCNWAAVRQLQIWRFTYLSDFSNHRIDTRPMSELYPLFGKMYNIFYFLFDNNFRSSPYRFAFACDVPFTNAKLYGFFSINWNFNQHL
jgi:hypothetical protein